MNTGNHLEQAAAQQRTRRVRAGQPLPTEPPSAPRAPSVQDYCEHDLEMPTGWELLAFGLVALALTACAGLAAFLIVRFMH